MKRSNIYYARRLRENQTYAEKKLWSKLRNRQLERVKFRRQFAIQGYILDFYSPEYKLAIEADGGQHYKGIDKLKDDLRTKKLSKQDIEVLRFSDRDILKNSEGVCQVILEAIQRKYR